MVSALEGFHCVRLNPQTLVSVGLTRACILQPIHSPYITHAAVYTLPSIVNLCQLACRHMIFADNGRIYCLHCNCCGKWANLYSLVKQLDAFLIATMLAVIAFKGHMDHVVCAIPCTAIGTCQYFLDNRQLIYSSYYYII